MRYLLPLLLLLPVTAVAQVVEELPTGTISVTCDAGGTTSVQFPATSGNYELVATDDLTACLGASTCGTGGHHRPKGNHGIQFVRAEVQVSCRSLTSATLQFIPVRVIR